MKGSYYMAGAALLVVLVSLLLAGLPASDAQAAGNWSNWTLGYRTAIWSNTTDNQTPPSEFPVCGDGVCHEWENSAVCPQDCGGNATRSCAESDGGRAFHIQGTAFGYTDTGTYFSYTDKCSATYPGWVSEWFCPEHGIVAEQSLICEYGCENGACLPPPTSPDPGNQTNSTV